MAEAVGSPLVLLVVASVLGLYSERDRGLGVGMWIESDRGRIGGYI